MHQKKTEASELTTRVAQVAGELYQLAYASVDVDLHITQVSPNFPSELADADLTGSAVPLVEAFGEFVGMEDVLKSIMQGDIPSFSIERVNRIQPDGSMRYLTFRAVPLDVQNTIAGLLVIVEDVSHFGLIEHSLVQSRNELRFVQDVLARTNAELDRRVEQRTAELAEAKQQIEQQLFRLQALRMNDLAILGTTDLRVALKTIAEQTRRQLNIDVASILLFNSNSLRVENAVVVGAKTSELQNVRIRLGETLVGRAALERKVLIIPDLTKEPQADLVGQMEGFQSCFVVPLIAKGNVVGVMYLGHRSPFEPDQDWLDFLESMSGQAAMAIESIKAFEDLQRSNFELALAYSRTIEGWSHALDLRDRETKDHTFRVTEVTLRLARLAGIKDIELMHIKHGALLHDIGKMGIPDAILLKEDYLSNDEWAIMRKHPTYAYEMLSPIEYLRPALEIPYCHHEKWDGTGYPRGLAGEQIPLAARLFAVVDVWDALRSDRPYRKGWNEAKVREHVRSLAGTHFDPNAVALFLRVMEEMDKENAKPMQDEDPASFLITEPDSSSTNMIHKDVLTQQLLDLGIVPGGVLLVHTSFSKVKPIEGGPIGLISALHSALGLEGTLVMPSMSYDDDHPFDKAKSHCAEMGVVADTFWRLPGVLRSDNNHAFAAVGPLAEKILASHPIDIPHGLDSPVGRVYELDGQVLLLGVDHTSNTTIHLCENMTGVRYRRDKYLTILKEGKPTRFEYREIDHCCENFSLVDGWLDVRQLQRRGKVGNADARLIRSQELVEVVTGRLKENETMFLHPPGTDEQCDDARMSLER